MSAHEILIAVMAVFAALGALDRILGNKFGIGKEFEEGILAMGGLAIAMIGVITLAPVLAAVLKPVVVPVFHFLGADAAMFAGSILACDMGGGALAAQMTENPDAALLGGVLTGSMLGATLVFTIPVAMGIMEEDDRPAMAKGILCGIDHSCGHTGRWSGSRVSGFDGAAKFDSHRRDCGPDRLWSLEIGKSNDPRICSLWQRCGGIDHSRSGDCNRAGIDRVCNPARYGADFGRFPDGG